MAEDVVEIETRPAEPTRNEKPSVAPTRKSDEQSQQKDAKPKNLEVPPADKVPAPLPRWPILVVGLVVAIFAASVLYIIFRPRTDVWTDDAYVMVHYATIAPRISGQIATVPVDDNDVVKTGQATLPARPARQRNRHSFRRGRQLHATDRDSMRSRRPASASHRS